MNDDFVRRFTKHQTHWAFENDPNYFSDIGIVQLPQTTVCVHRFLDHTSGDKFVILEFTKDGRLYRRRVDDFYSKTYCITLAKRFVEEYY